MKNSFKHIRPLKKPVFAFFGLLLVLLCSCDDRPRLTIDGGTNPTFKLSGNGNIAFIKVSGPDFENPNSRGPGSRYTKPYWLIVPESNGDTLEVAKVPFIVYGQVPKGFKQIYPEHGAVPEPIIEDEFFSFELKGANKRGVGARFVVHNGKVDIEGS
jgi:hypothetical protein